MLFSLFPRETKAKKIMKKLFIISSVLLAFVLIFLGIYNFVFKEMTVGIKKESLPDKQIESIFENSTQSASEKNDAEKEKIIALTSKAIISPAISADAKYIYYYIEEGGTAWKMSLDGSGKENISQDILTGLTDILWSQDNNKVISRFQKNTANKFYLYDYSASKGVGLKNGINNVAWTNMENKITYSYFDSKTKMCSLNMANSDGSSWKKIADLDSEKVFIAPVPQSSLISFWNYSGASNKTFFKTVGLAGGELETIFSEKFGADYLWSPDGKKFLVSFLVKKGGHEITLGVADNNGGNYQDLNIPTLASKCAWYSDKIIYCALPTSIPTGAVMPDDYYNKKITTRDTFWKIDTTTGKKERVVELKEIKGDYDASNLLLSAYESCLLFVNRIDGKLYRIEI